jgi:two-component system response regulator HydG
MRQILVIDDDMDMSRLLCHFLGRKGFQATSAFSGTKGLEKFKESSFDVVLCDFRLGDMDGVDILKEIKKINSDTVVIIITGYSDVKMAVEVMRLGAFDYITKPLIPEEVINVINNGLKGTAGATNDQGREKNRAAKVISFTNDFMVSKDTQAAAMYKEIELVAPTDYSVIIYGESGTGKEVIAKTIHQNSKRKDKPFLAVDCGTISRELATSELFGHVKGSFTGALTDKEGFFEACAGGTLFLDEIANLPLDVQAVLLRVIQEKKFKRVGASKDINSDVRILVASNENLQEAYKKGKFREDLYHRFNEFSISIPPLRSRKDDIIPFAHFFLKQACEELNKNLDGFDEEVLQLFLNYNWPGNLREFRNVIRRATLLSSSGKITSNVLPWEIIGSLSEPPVQRIITEREEKIEDEPDDIFIPGKVSFDLKDAASQAEYETIINVLKHVKFNKAKAARLLNIDRKTLYNKLKNYEEANKEA